MNKKGFIATSLLYSFFLVFCALILLYVANMAHSALLLSKEVDEINKDIHTSKKIENVKPGSYFRLNICVSNEYLYNENTMDYILIDNNTGTLVSRNVNYKVVDLYNNILNSVTVKIDTNNYTSRNIKLEDYNKMNNTILNEYLKSSSNYMIIDGNKYRYYQCDEKQENCALSNQLNFTDITNNTTDIYMRLAFDLPVSQLIAAGNGSINNPYILKGGQSC